MQPALLQLFAFVVLGMLWQFIQPKNITASSLQKPLITLIYNLLLPVLVFLVISHMKLTMVYLWMSLVVVVATLGALGIAWFWLRSANYSPQAKGALLLASAFSGVVFMGIPITNVMVDDWSIKMALDYMLVSQILILFTAGIYLAHSFAGGKAKFIQDDLLKEPVLWAIVAGIAVNLLGLDFPRWVAGVETMLHNCLVPLMLVAVGLSLKWNKSWMDKIVKMSPVAGIQLVVLPLLIFLLLKVFPSLGPQTSKALLIDGMMPSMAIGFLVCERYKFDVAAYTMAFSITFALSLFTVPIWYKVIF